MYQDERRLTGRDESTCLDLVQEAMLKAIRAIKPIGDYPHLRNWCGAWSKAWRTIGCDGKDGGVANRWRWSTNRRSPWCTSRRPRPAGVDRGTNARAARNLQQLFALRYRLGWTLEQIARRFGWKTGAVDGKLRRAIEQLRIKAEREF